MFTFFKKGGGEDQHALENATLEKRAEHGQKSHKQKLQDMKKQLAKITKMAMDKEAENERLDSEVRKKKEKKIIVVTLLDY